MSQLSPAGSPNQRTRVMLVDDSAVVRGLISRWLEAEGDIEIVARSRTGLQAIRDAEATKPEVIVLDIEMPEMDGLEALPSLLKCSPGVRILIASSLSQRNAKISLLALSKGAHDYVPKPTTNSGLTTSTDFRTELIAKINALCPGRARSAPSPKPAPAAPSATAAPAAAPRPSPARSATAPKASDTNGGTLRSFNAGRPEILCIGSSTGGPRALQTLLSALAPHLGQIPVVLTQHMPKTFTTVFAEHLGKALPLPVKEAENGEKLTAGHIYIAPGDRHMVLQRGGAGVELVLDDGPEVNFCKPAVDVMFNSAAEVFRKGVLGVVLTGMGNDGAKGGCTIANSGGNVFAQDEASSIVWGMPGATYKAGACAGVFALDDLAPRLAKVIKEGRL